MHVQTTPAVVPGRRSLAPVAVLALAAFLAVLDGTIVSVAIGTFATTFDRPVSTVAWVSVGYLLAAASTLPASGWAVERFGGRRVFLTGLGLFSLGSLLASTAGSAGALIGARVVQGLGGGILEPTALTLAARAAGQQRLGRVMGLLSLVINVAPVIGPLAGGFFTTGGNWRWLFLVNLPVALVVAVGALALLPGERGSAAAPRADLVGLVLLSPGFAAALLAVERLGAGAPAAVVAASGLAGAGLLAGYVRHARRHPQPLVDLRLLGRTPDFAASVAVMAFVGFVMYSQLVALPLHLHEQHGWTGAGQGLLVTSLGLGLLVSMSLAGRRSDVVGPRPLARRGALATAAGLGAFAVAHQALPLWAQVALFVVVGLGFGSVASPTFSSVYRTVPEASAGQATTTMFIVVQLGASLGVTVVGLAEAHLADGSGLVFTALAAAALAMAALGRRLPGAPGPAGEPTRP